jgi:hypothetical protein
MWKILLSKSSIMAQRVILNIKTENKKPSTCSRGEGLGGIRAWGLEGIRVWRLWREKQNPKKFSKNL